MATFKQSTIKEPLTLSSALNLVTPQTIKYQHGNDIKLPYLKDPSLIVGLELELENFSITSVALSGFMEKYYRLTEDHSLRNNGYELQGKPMQIGDALRVLYDTYSLLPKETSVSTRCSVHVHVNMLTETFETLERVIALYLLYEDALFKFVGYDRQNSNFCVPLNRFLSQGWSVLNNLNGLQNKYQALSLFRLNDLGTIEWRQLCGTKDYNKVCQWLQLISAIHGTAKEPNDKFWEEIHHLNTSSSYMSYTSKVFKSLHNLLDDRVLAESMPDAVSLVKIRKNSLIQSGLYKDWILDQSEAHRALLITQQGAAPEVAAKQKK